MPDSDVDIAVAGLATADFWAAWRVAEDILEDRLVDLVELEEVGEGLRKAIEPSVSNVERFLFPKLLPIKFNGWYGLGLTPNELNRCRSTKSREYKAVLGC